MPKYVTEIAQGNSFSESSEGGRGAFSATRAWKVILLSPNEAIDINAVTGVSVGTPYSEANPIPCVSIEGRADGDSRLVKIITATYRATAGVDPAVDPMTLEPTQRPALYSMSTTLTEITAWGGQLYNGGVPGAWGPSVNPAGDLVDGVTRLEPVVTITIDQYSFADASAFMGYAGYVNSDSFTFSDLTILPHCCMLQGLATQPVVEQFGTTTYRVFKTTFTFGVRAHYTFAGGGVEAIGWDVALPQSGFNVINTGLGRSDVDSDALSLEHEGQKIKEPRELAFGTDGKKMRASVTIASGDGGSLQRPSAQPVALNDDGTPRSRNASPPVLVNRISLQPEMPFGNNFSAFGIRWIG